MLYKTTHFDKSQTEGGSITDKRVNPDLAEERAKSNFDKQELKLVFGDTEMIDELENYMKDFANHPELLVDPSYMEMNREEQMAEWWKRLLIAYKLDRKKFFYNVKSNTIQWFMLNPGTSPLLLHF